LEAAAKGWTRINGFSERLIDWMRYEEETTNHEEAHHD
jgi:hypothetical protein